MVKLARQPFGVGRATFDAPQRLQRPNPQANRCDAFFAQRPQGSDDHKFVGIERSVRRGKYQIDQVPAVGATDLLHGEKAGRLAGRSNESKQAFYKKVVENLAADPGIPPANVMVTISENHDIDWSFHDGVAQFLVDPD